MGKRILFILLMLAGPQILCAQPYPYLHFTRENGLPSDNVYTVYRDRAGFLWFGTDMGIARYNGLHFEHFTTADGLPDNEIFSFKEDPYGRLWIGTYNGRLCYYQKGKFFTEKNTPFLKLPFKPFNITQINVESDSSITIMFVGMRRFVNIKNTTARTYNLQGIIKEYGNEIKSVRKVSQNSFQVLNGCKHILIDSNERIISSNPAKNYNYFFDNRGSGYLLDENNKVYSAEEKLLLPMSFKYPRDLKIIPKVFILSLYVDKGNLFLCTRNGLFINNSVHLFKGIIVTNVHADIDGNYWVTTYKDGIYKLANMGGYYRYTQAVYLQRILFAQYANNKLYYYISGSDKLFKYEHDQVGVINRHLGYEEATRVDVERWACFLVNNDSDYTYVTRKRKGMGLYAVKGKQRWAAYYPGWERQTLALFKADSSLYGLDNHEIYKIDYNRFLRRQPDSLRIIFSTASLNDRILGRAMDSGHSVWFSTNEHTYKIIGDKPIPQAEFDDLKLRKFIFSGNYLIGYDVENNLILAKQSNGHYIADTVKTDEHYIWGHVYQLDSLHVLFSTNWHYMLLTIAPTGNNGAGYSIKPIQNPFISKTAEYIYADSLYCYFFKGGNVTRIRLDLLYGNPPAPKVLFTNCNTATGSYDIAQPIIMRQKQAKNISIDFTGISFSSNEIAYQYSITNDASAIDWHSITSNTISFPSLSYGQYFIKLRARSPASNYSDVNTIVLTVEKPFWLSWWFIGIVAIAFVLLLIGTVRLIIRRLLLKRKKEYDANMRYYGAEYKALNALMNPHFIFNSLNNIQGLINSDDKKAANKFLMNFSTLVRQNMQNVSKGTVTLQEELDLIKNYLFLEKMRFDDFVNYTFDIDPKVETEDIHVPPLLIQPLVENAIKHGLLPLQTPDGMVTIRVYQQDNDLFIDIIDNGVGYLFHQKESGGVHTSLGLDNLNKRTAYAQMLHKQNITFSIRETTDNDGNITGTIATLEIKAEQNP